MTLYHFLLELNSPDGWYEQRRVGLGEEFLSCVDACIRAIYLMPEMYGIIYESYRRGLV